MHKAALALLVGLMLSVSGSAWGWGYHFGTDLNNLDASNKAKRLRPLKNHTDKWLCNNLNIFVNPAFTTVFSQKTIRDEAKVRSLKCGFRGTWFD